MIILPGHKIAPVSSSTLSQTGTYICNGYIYSSLMGELKSKTIMTEKTRLDSGHSVTSYEVVPTLTNRESKVMPIIGGIIIGKVVKISARAATVDILLVDSTISYPGYQGIIRCQDVYPSSEMAKRMQSDDVSPSSANMMLHAFRPGDVVKAKVIALGEKNTFYLSTEKTELGVLQTTTRAHSYLSNKKETLLPLDSNNMISEQSKMTESRKVAKPS